jgi:uncharacterized protein (DUF924 family)
MTDWVADVLRFWFEEIAPKQWFEKDEAFDQALRRKFLSVHASVAALPVRACLTDAETALAAVIVCDQFPRNMFRGTPEAFGADAKALALAERALALGFDAKLPETRRQFFYLPFEHAEDRQAQVRSLALFAPLGEEYMRWAQAHKAIIDRFGRFPHRNAILGRASTPEEIEFLSQPDSSF